MAKEQIPIDQIPTMEELEKKKVEAFQDQEDLQDKIDTQESAEDMQEDMELQELQGMADSIPAEQKQENLFKLFGEVWKNRDPDMSSKVANLSNLELGRPLCSVRDCRGLAMLGDLTGHKGWAKFWNNQARMVNETSMSKGGWFSTLFISSKKFTTRATHSGMPTGFDITSGKKKKWSFFSKSHSNDQQRGDYGT